MLNIITGLQDSLVKLQSNDETAAINDVKEKTKELKEIMNTLEQNKEIGEDSIMKQIRKTVGLLESSLSRF
jgi:predicted AlkP superfamily phosphohydrolase/phosphomutase